MLNDRGAIGPEAGNPKSQGVGVKNLVFRTSVINTQSCPTSSRSSLLQTVFCSASQHEEHANGAPSCAGRFRKVSGFIQTVLTRLSSSERDHQKSAG